jgi:Lrp/AsnC family leucine-responsive transcriptional regulator
MHIRQSRSGKLRLDNTDIQILKILRDDSRVSVLELAKRVYLSRGAVNRRIMALVDAGVIKKFTIEIDREKLEEE